LIIFEFAAACQPRLAGATSGDCRRSPDGDDRRRLIGAAEFLSRIVAESRPPAMSSSRAAQV
jgi:hypothetical protein